MQAFHRVAMNTGILYARMGITVFISLYTTRVILNTLGAGDFGIFNIVGGAIAMLTFLNTSMAAASQRFMSYAQGEGDAEKQRSIFNVSVVLHAAIAFVVLAVLEGAGWVLFHGVFKIAPDRMHAAWMIYQFAAISTLFTIVSVPYDAVINAHENMLLFAVLGVVEAVLKLVIALFIVHVAGDKLIFYGFWMAGIAIFLMLLRALYCHAKYAECVIAPRSYFRKPLFREMTSFAGWSLLGSSSGMIANYGQGVVLNTFFGTIVNAAQGVANQVSGQLGAFASTMLKALTPVIAKSEGAGDRQKMLKASMVGTKIAFLLLVVFYVPMLIEMPYVFKIWLKHPPEYAVIFCRLLLVRFLIDQLFVTLGNTVSAVGNIRGYQIATSALNFSPLIITFLLFALGMPPWGLYLVFIAYALASAGISLWFSRRHCGLELEYFLKDVVLRCLAIFACSFAVGVLPKFFMQESLFRLIVTVILGFVAFCLGVYAFAFCLDDREKIGESFVIFRERIHGLGKGIL